jgi:hypothetical protein
MNLDRLPRVLLRLEGLALAVGALLVYADADYSWLALVALALAPDVSFVGLLGGPRVAAAAYNAAHTLAVPIGLATAGVLANSSLAVQLALIWLAHIGVDRLVGYGLRYPTRFKETHLQRV